MPSAITANRKINFHIKRQLIGYPFSPEVGERANCGPTVLAAILGSDTDEAIELMDHTYQKGWNGYTNIGHIKAALKYHDISMNKTKEFDGIKELTITTFPQAHVLLFLQIEGPWEESKYWRAAYNRTHWCLAYAARMLDVNNLGLSKDPSCRVPAWIPVRRWQDIIIPRVVALFEGATGWHVRSGYYVEELK